MVVLRREKAGRGGDLRDDGTGESPRLPGQGGAGRGFLFGVPSQDEATVLGAHVRPLAVEGGGVMALPEDLQ